MSFLRFLLPFSYFFKSRLQKARDIIFHFYYEWLIAFLLLAYFTNDSLERVAVNFFLAYFAFISIYEIGYLGNDVYSVRNEKDPRLRIKNFNPTNTQLILWVLVRITIFLLISLYLKVMDNPVWIVFYLLIILFFLLHNIIKQKEYKVFTFINLAFTRFLAPVFIFLTSEQLMLIIPSIILNYVLYRTLTYMDSKQLLVMPNRTEAGFKLNYYLLIGGLSILLSLFYKSYIPLLLNGYYLVFWLLFFLKEKSRRKSVL